MDGDVITEFGFEQPVMDIFLIPVTGSFGLFFLWRRFSPFRLDNYNTLKLGIVVLTVFIINACELQYNVFDVLGFRTDNFSDRRPIFIILIPIYISLVLTRFRISKNIYFIATFTLVIVYFNFFVLHYIALFLLGGYLSESSNKLRKFIPNLLCFVIICLTIQYFEIKRVSLLAELVYVFNFVSMITFFASKIEVASFMPRNFSILYFYIAQAFAFTFLRDTDLNIFNVNLTLLVVFIVSSTLAIVLPTTEKILARRYKIV
ncbi:hypothetical protein N9P85_00620 [Amylibacter sp.]|nr:hypothetical protein [Amylibacter sp.]